MLVMKCAVGAWEWDDDSGTAVQRSVGETSNQKGGPDEEKPTPPGNRMVSGEDEERASSTGIILRWCSWRGGRGEGREGEVEVCLELLHGGVA